MITNEGANDKGHEWPFCLFPMYVVAIHAA